MKLGTLDIKKAYLGAFQLTHNNAFVQEEPLIPVSDREVFYIKATGPSQSTANIGLASLSVNQTLQYSRDLATWTTMDINTTIQLDVSEKSQTVYLRGKLTGNNSDDYYTQFTLTGGSLGGYIVGGNIMCLYDYETLPTTITYEHAFRKLFFNCNALRIARNLFDYVTTLSRCCYLQMFSGCTGLIVAPELPATGLAVSCYQNMFNGCTSLTTSPALPATSLANYCYSNMFNCCTSLTSAPELLATTLLNSCYRYMFNGCTSLNYVKCLANSDINTTNVYEWMTNVAASGTFIKHPDATWPSGTVPSGWTVQNA